MKAFHKIVLLVTVMALCAALLGGMAVSADLTVGDEAGEGDVIDWNDLFGENNGEVVTTEAATTTAAKEEKGCGSSLVGVSVLAMAAVGAVLLRKNEE